MKKGDTPITIAKSCADFTDKQHRCSIVAKTVLISKKSHTRDEDQNVKPSMNFNKEQRKMVMQK
ncbi:hypothetical protein DPMN_013683 [Dreissena polymorpha]|uniref:Uncharacterized protein n=1 Tax=Dreissena polymorpha TaxID=45954 RepID=A0A9D4N9E7_DREPO|nr:hypothetical protein DPMN_013683 [Dreissena polymorpha]